MKKYFLPPTRDVPPIGPIRLGRIVVSPRSPEEPLSSDPPPAIPSRLLVPPFEEPNWSWQRDAHASGHASVFASFLEFILGTGAELGVQAMRKSHEAVHAHLTTYRFIPDLPYVQEAVAAPDVQDYLRNKRVFGRKHIYMITGIKVATNASYISNFLRERGIFAYVASDMTPAGAPGLSVGTNTGLEQAERDIVSSKDIPAFVFAFSLRRVKYTSNSASEAFQHEDYTKGALYSIPDSGNDEEDEYNEPIEANGLDEEDVAAEEFMLMANDAIDKDGEICQVIPPLSRISE